MLAKRNVTINGREYTVHPFRPIDALEFLHERTRTLANRQSTFTQAREIYCQCDDEMGRSLADDEAFFKCFTDHPEDMLDLEKAAMEILVAPFVSKESAT
jgi:hypothetical protein